MLIDLHTHSYPMSDDSFVGVDELVASAKEAGLDAICLTEHDVFWPIEDVDALSRKHEFLVLPGCEINTDTGHVLVFGLDRYEFGLHKPRFLHSVVQRKGAAVVAAHPYRRRSLAEAGDEPQAWADALDRASQDGLFQVCHAIEALNGRGSPLENDFSRELGELLGARMTGGSDAHHSAQLGTAATEFHRPIEGLNDLIRELRAGRFHAVDLRNGHEVLPKG